MTEDVAMLLRRAGFGPTAGELGSATVAGYAATVSGMLAPSGPDLGAQSAPVPRLGLDPFAGKSGLTREQRAPLDDIRRQQTGQIIRWWLDRMTVANHQALEKLIFFWHGHWATSVRKVQSPQLMLAQQRTLRDVPDFATMVRQMIVDLALVIWLDGQHNTKKAPNENLARELFELFTLGIGHYTERDVKEAARALTGWRVGLTPEKAIFDKSLHDNGPKTILGTTSRFTAASLANLVLGHEACPRFIASRLWFRYGSSSKPIPDGLRERMAEAFPDTRTMLRVLLTDEAFHDSRGTMVKQPVEWLIGALRQLGLRPADLPAQTLTRIVDGLDDLGQTPFAPPSVGGWPTGAAWLTSGAAEVRLRLANELAKLVVAERMTPESLAYVLCVDRWTNRTYAVLRDVRDARLLLTLGLVSPEYLVT